MMPAHYWKTTENVSGADYYCTWPSSHYLSDLLQHTRLMDGLRPSELRVWMPSPQALDFVCFDQNRSFMIRRAAMWNHLSRSGSKPHYCRKAICSSVKMLLILLQIFWHHQLLQLLELGDSLVAHLIICSHVTFCTQAVILSFYCLS